MTAKDIVAELTKLGNAQTKKTWMTHGAQEPCLGVKVEDMKKIQKRVRRITNLHLMCTAPASPTRCTQPDLSQTPQR